MIWLAVDLALILGSLLVLAGIAAVLWRRAAALGRQINAVRSRVISAAGPSGGPPLEPWA